MNKRGVMTSLVTIGAAGAALYGINRGMQNGTFQRMPQNIANAMNNQGSQQSKNMIQQGANAIQQSMGNNQQGANSMQQGAGNKQQDANSMQQNTGNKQQNSSDAQQLTGENQQNSYGVQQITGNKKQGSNLGHKDQQKN